MPFQMRQMPRNIKRKVAKVSKLLTKKEIVKKEIEIAQVRVFSYVMLLALLYVELISCEYSRIPLFLVGIIHYNDFHEVGSQFVKRSLSVDNDYPEFDHGKEKAKK
ncbi:542_t:CDS:1 [Funneliformis caledonium]|uniref:542_t:CDS:1 n=1 Tax=Funneliformis caledonium TaxID=1117310 RepID=A0A9N9APC6_9GLOM|nr:542_t:CDS:1 [Funneliformis caledonium]